LSTRLMTASDNTHNWQQNHQSYFTYKTSSVFLYKKYIDLSHN